MFVPLQIPHYTSGEQVSSRTLFRAVDGRDCWTGTPCSWEFWCRRILISENRRNCDLRDSSWCMGLDNLLLFCNLLCMSRGRFELVFVKVLIVWVVADLKLFCNFTVQMLRMSWGKLKSFRNYLDCMSWGGFDINS